MPGGSQPASAWNTEEEMSEVATYICTICGEPSTGICIYCTKDACPNHLCAKCRRCSDCCECEVPLEEETDPPSEPVPETTASEAAAPELRDEPPDSPPAPPSEEQPSAEDPDRQSEQDPQQREYPANSDSHEPEREQQNPS